MTDKSKLIRLEPNQNDNIKKTSEKDTFKDKNIEKSDSQKKFNLFDNQNNKSKKKYPKITSIQTQKKKGRYNIFLNGKYAFPVDESIIANHRLRKGLEISPELQARLTTEDGFYKAYQRSLQYLSYGLRSEKEVRDDLIKYEFEDYADEVISKLEEQRYLNDVEYAKAFVRTAANVNRKGPRVIERDLFRKGISETNILDALPEYSFEDQIENAIILAEKQWKKAKNKSEREAIQKVHQYLMKKGYDRDVIDSAIEQIDTVKNEEQEYRALKRQGEKAWKRYQRKTDGYDLLQKTRNYLFGKGYPVELINQFMDEKEE